MTKNYLFLTREKNKIQITTFGNSQISEKNCLIFVHGFKGFKDWGFIPYFGEYFSNKGYFVITFNFSHNGIGRKTTEFTELHKFAENTYSLEISELTQIISAYTEGFFGKISDSNKIGLVGHSRGGAVSIIAANISKKINALVTWSSISNFDRFTERHKKEWRTKGFFEVLNSRTNQIMRLNKNLLDDIETNLRVKLNLEMALKRINIPYLILHGEQDLSVPIAEAELLFSWSDKFLTALIKIPRTGHTFNIKHPFEGSNQIFDTVLEYTNNFFNKHF